MADRTPSAAEEARHLHACLFRAPLDAVVVARYEAAQQQMGLAASSLTAAVVTRRLDAEAVEFALRRRGKGADLTRRLQILCYLVEVRRDYLAEFVNLGSPANPGSVRSAWAALLAATLRSGWKRLKGEYLVRRYELL